MNIQKQDGREIKELHCGLGIPRQVCLGDQISESQDTEDLDNSKKLDELSSTTWELLRCWIADD